MQIKFNTDSAVFDGDGRTNEIDRILKVISDEIKIGCDCGSIIDASRHRIGWWIL